MKKSILMFSILVFASLSLFSQKSETFVQSGKAIRGYDPVAYFSEGKPVKGEEKLVYNWNNANWYFSSQQNLDLFKANPEKYAPQYGVIVLMDYPRVIKLLRMLMPGPLKTGNCI